MKYLSTPVDFGTTFLLLKESVLYPSRKNPIKIQMSRLY